MISIEPFNAHWQTTDDHGKHHRHECQVVGVTDDGKFLVIATAEDEDEVGTFEVDRVFLRSGKPPSKWKV